MSEPKTVAKAEVENQIGELQKPAADVDVDIAETQEWIASLDYVLKSKGPDRVRFLIEQLRDKAAEEGIQSAEDTNTPYVNTIPVKDQPAFPGNREIERRIKSIVRWNAMAMVVRGNKRAGGVGGHISTFASSATLYEIGFNHFFHGRGEDGYSGDTIFFQGHASPGMYSRAFIEDRLTEENLENFRRELRPIVGLVELSASLVDARFLGVSDRLDGPGTDHGDLPGTVQRIPPRSRLERHLGAKSLGLLGGRRM